MPEMIYTPDGKSHAIFEREHFKELVRTYLGTDAERYIGGLEAAADYTEQKIGTDLDSYEASLDSNLSAFNDLLDQLEDIIDMLDRPRVNRELLRSAADSMSKIISNQI